MERFYHKLTINFGIFSFSKFSLWQKLQHFFKMLPQTSLGGVRKRDLLHSPFHRHGANVSPLSVQTPGSLLDGVTLCLISARVRIV